MDDHPPRAALPALLALGAALRLPWLASRPLWLDEALQHWVSSPSSPVEVIARASEQDGHPPGFALLAWAALRVGDADVWLRLPSYAAGVAMIAVAWAAGAAWADRRAGMWLAAWVAVAPILVAWSREGRPYAVAALAVLGLFAAAGEHVRRPTRRSTWILAGATAAAMPWHWGAWLVVVGILAGVLSEPSARRGALPALGAAVLGGALLAPSAALVASLPPDLEAWTGAAGAARGALPALGWMLTGSSRPAVGVVGLGVVAALGVAARRADRTLLIAAVAPWILVGIAAVSGTYPLGPVRHVLVLLPGSLLLLAAVRPPTAAAAALWVALVGATVARGPGLVVWDTPALLASLEGRRSPSEPVWVHPALSWPVRRYGVPDGAAFGAWGDAPPDHGWVLAPVEVALPDGLAEIRADGVHAVRYERTGGPG